MPSYFFVKNQNIELFYSEFIYASAGAAGASGAAASS